MLVLSRRPGERIRIGDSIVVALVQIRGRSARLGVEAPPEVAVVRDELLSEVSAPRSDRRGERF